MSLYSGIITTGNIMADFKTSKVVSSLPAAPYIPSCMYFVRVGEGFDMHVSSSDGLIAHSLNTKDIDISDPSAPPSRSQIDSRGGGLLTNGTGLMGARKSKYGVNDVLYNFDTTGGTGTGILPEFDGRLLDGVGIGFTTTGAYRSIGTDASEHVNEIIAVNPNLTYKGSGSVVPNQDSVDSSQRAYAGHMFMDLNGLAITANKHQHFGLAKLAQDLTLGTDTWLYVYRDDAVNPHTEWIIGDTGANAYALRRGLKFWDHCFADQKVDDNGDPIPFSRASNTGNPLKPAGFGYSRHMVYDLWDNTAGLWEQANDGSGAGNWNGHTNVWRHPIKTAHGTHYNVSFAPASTATVIPESTAVSQNWHGSTYKYCYLGGSIMSDTKKFLRYEGWVGGIDFSGKNRGHGFPPAAAGATWMMLCNYEVAAVGTPKQTHSALSMIIDPSVRSVVKSDGLLPEHTYVHNYKVEATPDGSGIVSTLVTTARTTLANRVDY